MNENAQVNGWQLPSLLIELMLEGKWKTPDHEIILKIAPFLKEELEFLPDLESMEINSKIDLSEFEHFFHADSRKDPRANNLPWLDSSKSVLIAVNRIQGDDIAITLDYRETPENPRVIGSNWHTNEEPNGVRWELISNSFEEFVKGLKLTD